MGEKTAYNVAVGNAIKKARIAAGMSQSELAEELEFKTPHTIYQYESGARSVTPNTAAAMSVTLGTSVKSFYPEPHEVAGYVNQIRKGQDGKREEKE